MLAKDALKALFQELSDSVPIETCSGGITRQVSDYLGGAGIVTLEEQGKNLSLKIWGNRSQLLEPVRQRAWVLEIVTNAENDSFDYKYVADIVTGLLSIDMIEVLKPKLEALKTKDYKSIM